MRKIIGLIVGGVIGAIAGYILGLFVELVSCVLGGFDGIISGEPIYVIVSIIGAIIGFFVGNSIDKEEKEKLKQKKQAEIAYQYKLQQEALAKAERERKEALAKAERERKEAFNNWKEELGRRYSEIKRMSLNQLLSTDVYSKIFNQENIIPEEYKQYFYSVLNNHRNEMIRDIRNNVARNKEGIFFSLNKMYFLKASYKNDSRFDLAINKLNDFATQIQKPEPQYLAINNYGNCYLPLDNSKEMEDIDNHANQIMKKLKNDLSCFSNNNDGFFDGITQHMDKDFLYNVARIMWYYAKSKPFNVNKFEEARSLYNKYTSFNYVPSRYTNNRSQEHTYQIGKVEEILAVIYAKNQIGGKGTVQQEKEYIDIWVEAKIKEKNKKECSIFVSGLAWLELYEFELDILRKMVQNNLQLSSELQERLRFLESGGTSSNIKVYEVEPEIDFIYDSSSENWNTNEFNVFFRKVGMKKLALNYSLSISTWKKTLPLSNGQKASMNELYQEFESMVNDFDGEVICKRTKAKAIDLDNVSYPDAVVFQFTSERNKCLSMMFSCEKFGRNLNLTIITMFTPENGIDVENLQKYAIAIKSNIYVDSFRETVLQAVDEVIKEKRDIYDDNSNSSSGKKFVE